MCLVPKDQEYDIVLVLSHKMMGLPIQLLIDF
uniref:Uncharacterized protein n=1 Tax=Arundo donax TaxID=35708 RepID=A0A0A8XTM8_ARUDO